MCKLYMIILIFSAVILEAGTANLISDPAFKKAEDNWFLRKSKEYKSVKETYKKGIFSFFTPASSAKTYLALYHQLELEEGEKYMFTVEVKTKGEGVITYGYGTYGDIFGGKQKKKKVKSKKEQKGQNLGLMASRTDFSPEWKEHVCYFTVRKKTSDLPTFIKVLLGEYQGDFAMRNPQLIKIDSLPSGVTQRGSVEIKEL
ncbi:hypothetical protein PQO03_18735 [Lentisphaera profundi]|uniref:CBM-cenC domain-containing protein n=1 Tax=Lentisphaera profundi TaxID=1658616 RepID=A0ABY7VUH8_9BACT|nr:hypothetical protein [Lentisphaera profundi]WDE97865.1 hypothetical protein PQO03_18735 [Lentisphaera profundi]